MGCFPLVDGVARELQVFVFRNRTRSNHDSRGSTRGLAVTTACLSLGIFAQVALRVSLGA